MKLTKKGYRERLIDKTIEEIKSQGVEVLEAAGDVSNFEESKKIVELVIISDHAVT